MGDSTEEGHMSPTRLPLASKLLHRYCTQAHFSLSLFHFLILIFASKLLHCFRPQLPIIHCLAVVDNYGQQSGSVRTMVVFRQRWFCNNRCDPKMVQRSKDGLFCNDSCTVTTVARQGRSSSNCPEAGSVDQATGLP